MLESCSWRSRDGTLAGAEAQMRGLNPRIRRPLPARKIAPLAAGTLLLLPCAPTMAAVCASTQECLQRVERVQGETRTLSADFTQVKHVSLLEQPVVSTGQLLVKRPDHVLVRMLTPNALTVRINGGQLDIPGLSERDRQALSMAPMAGLGGNLGAIFSGSIFGLRQNFDVTASGDDSGITMRLVPKDATVQQSVRSIELRFEGPELVIQRVQLADALGDTLEITLDRVQRNVDIPDAVFSAKDG